MAGQRLVWRILVLGVALACAKIGSARTVCADSTSVPEPLLEALAGTDPAAVARALAAGADPNGMLPLGTTPLMLAALGHRVQMVRLLIAAGADVRHVAAGRHTVLMAAVVGDADGAAHADVASTIALLVASGADVEARRESGESALDLAVTIGSTRATRALIAAGADVNAHGPGGRTPLMAAIAHGNERIAAILIGAGARVDAIADDGASAATLAQRDGRTAMVRMLDAARAGVPPARDPAFAWRAARDGDTEDILTAFAAGAEVDAADEAGETALMLAARAGHGDVVALLLAHGADPTRRNAGGASAVGIAAHAGHRDVVTTLVADPRVTPAIIAALDSSTPALVRRAAAFEIGFTGRTDLDPQLRALARDRDDRELAAAAWESIMRLPRPDPRAHHDAALASADQDVAIAAAEAVATSDDVRARATARRLMQSPWTSSAVRRRAATVLWIAGDGAFVVRVQRWYAVAAGVFPIVLSAGLVLVAAARVHPPRGLSTRLAAAMFDAAIAGAAATLAWRALAGDAPLILPGLRPRSDLALPDLRWVAVATVAAWATATASFVGVRGGRAPLAGARTVLALVLVAIGAPGVSALAAGAVGVAAATVTRTLRRDARARGWALDQLSPAAFVLATLVLCLLSAYGPSALGTLAALVAASPFLAT